MGFLRVDLCFLLIFSIIYTEAGLNPEKDNVCLKTITYNETIKLEARRPTSKKDKVICLKENNCDEETTVETKEARVITRTKILPSCCAGYEEDPKGTQCVPVCPKGCGSGKCVAPGKCSCEAGFFGSECDKICDENRWGKNCIFECNCSENEVCNKIFGCTCKPGWIGERCTTPCPPGYYGFVCQGKCSCAVNLCDHVTGMCIDSKERLNNLPPGKGSEMNEKPKTRSSNVSNATNPKLLEFRKAEDRLPESNFSVNASRNEIFTKKLTSIANENDEAAVPNPPFLKGDEVDEREEVKESARAKSPIPVHETNLRDPVGFLEASKTYDTRENSRKIDILKEMATNLTALKENIFQRNELLAGTSDSQTTPVGNVPNSRVSNFIPTFTVLSGVTFLIIFIIGKRLIITFRKKIKKMADTELGRCDEGLSILPSEKFTWENNLENPAYETDILNAVPILQTFKPGVLETDNMSTEKKVMRVPECFT